MIYDFQNPLDAVRASGRTDVEQINPSLSIYRPESADIKMARQLADEMVNVSGAEIKVFLRTDNADYDEVWDEDPDPTYWNPFIIKGYFKPEDIEVELHRWGLDTQNKITITFSHRQIYEKVGERMLRSGDVLQIPFNAVPISPKNYRIVNATPSGNFRYTWLYLKCAAELLTADVTVRPERDTQNEFYG